MFYAHMPAYAHCALGNVFYTGGSMDMGGHSQVNVRANLSKYLYILVTISCNRVKCYVILSLVAALKYLS